MNKLKIFFLIFWIFSISEAKAEDPRDLSLLTLERIYSSKEFREERTIQTKWMDHSSNYTVIQKSLTQDSGDDIVSFEPGNDQGTVLVSAEKLVPKGQNEPLDIYDYDWSPDGSKMLIFTNTRKVWRYHTKGDYWLLDLTTWDLRKLGGDSEEASLMFATFSPDSQKIAYVMKHNLYVEDVAQGGMTALTQDGSEKIINGTFDWAYEEEFDLRNGFRWSPDSTSLAYWRLDASLVKDFYMINNTDNLYSTIIPVQYPKVGESNSSAKIGVVLASGGPTVWMNLEGDPAMHYLPRMDWAGNSEEIVFQRMNRLQNTNTLFLANKNTGECKVVLEEKDQAWLDTVDDLQFFEDGNFFLWMSERENWKKMYLVSRDGKTFKSLTPDSFDVISIVRIDDQSEWVYFVASPDNPADRYLFRASLKKMGLVERVSPNEKGTHSYSISPNGKFAIHSFSSFDSVTTTRIISLPDHKVLKTLNDNHDLREKVQALKRYPVEFFQIRTEDQIALDGWCMKPYNFDPTKTYPVLFYVYGEPAGQTVLNRWSGRYFFWHTMLNQMGYIVMSVDNRGTPSPKGRDFRKCVYGSVGVLSSLDQAQAVQALVAERPYLDKDRIAIWGWSGGGSMSLNAIFRYPDIYKTAMAVAPVADQRYYDSIYQERYMGLPDSNREGYEQGSPINFAKNLKGNLLVVHGTGDDNVHYQGTEALINELVRHNKLFSLMIYPNRSHSIREGENTTRHVFETLTAYLKDKMPADR